MTNAEIAAYFSTLAPDDQAEIWAIDHNLLCYSEEAIYTPSEIEKMPSSEAFIDTRDFVCDFAHLGDVPILYVSR